MAARVNKWLVMATSTMVNMLYFGLAFQFGSLFIALLDTFNRDRSSTATIQSLQVGFTIGFGVISGALIKRYGLHHVTLLSSILVPLGLFISFFATSVEYLYVSIGIVTGIGNSLGYTSCLVVLGRVFTGRQMVLALAVNNSASAVGGLVYPYIIDLLLFQFGLRGTFLILSALQSNACVLCVMCWINKDQIKEPNTNNDHSVTTVVMNSRKDAASSIIRNVLQRLKGNTNMSTSITLTSYQGNGETIQNSLELNKKRTPSYIKVSKAFEKVAQNIKSLSEQTTFMFILFGTAFTLPSLNGYLLLLLDISIWKGLTNNQGLFAFVIFNIANGIMSILIGILKQKKGISCFIFPVISSLSGCISGPLYYLGTSYIAYLGATCLVGVAVGGIVSSFTAIIVKISPQNQVPIALGLQLTLTGIITAGIGPLFGRVRDVSGSYGSVVLTISALNAAGFVLYCIALLYRRRDNRREPSCAEIRVTTTKL